MPFTLQELLGRAERARALMRAAGLDALVVSSTPNWRYFTDLDLILLVAPSRPVFFVLPAAGDPVIVTPSIFAPEVAALRLPHRLHTWPAPRPHDDGVTLLAGVLMDLPRRFGRVGFELGSEMRLGMPVQDYLRLHEACRAWSFVDAAPLLWTLRSAKSDAELERMGRAAKLAGEALEAEHFDWMAGLTETEVARIFTRRALDAGVDAVGYLALGSGAGGYSSITRPPGERVVRGGDVLSLDVGCTVGGYWCDFNRNVALGDPAPGAQGAYAQLYAATEAGLRAARVGVRASELWQAMAAVLGPAVPGGEGAPRFGHGLGLGFTEPPSIHPEDHTRLAPGMVLAIEPSLAYQVGSTAGTRLMVHEENIVVTEDGPRLLTGRAPPSLPVAKA